MIYLNIPVGGAHGWGVCGKSLAREMARLSPVRLLTDPFSAGTIGDEIECAALQRLLPPPAEAGQLASVKALDGQLLQLANKQLEPMRAGLRGSFTLGYTFFEDTELLPRYLENARRFDLLAAGSNWCGEVLRGHGLSNVTTVLQGVDREVFFPVEGARRFFPDRFLVFSGGKFEFRKGHDLVIRAFKVLHDRHPDVMLITSWFNAWEFSFRSMQQSQHIRFEPGGADPMAKVLADNGIDLRRVIAVGPRGHATMADVYRNTDVGIFPNRAEGGTNLVLMEYMACGKPVLATATTGHADVITSNNARILSTAGTVTSSSDGVCKAIWPEPVLEDVIESLEWAYQNRDALTPLAMRAAR